MQTAFGVYTSVSRALVLDRWKNWIRMILIRQSYRVIVYFVS